MLEKIHQCVKMLFDKYNLSIPVDLDKIVKGEKINFAYDNLIDAGGAFSGLCMINENGVSIVINENHPETRQRFTLAHELGHYFLHMNKSLSESVFVDKASLYRRDSSSSSGEIKQEIEANRFAAELLMPEGEVFKAIGTRFDFDNIKSLADKFGVSEQAMSIRLTALGYV